MDRRDFVKNGLIGIGIGIGVAAASTTVLANEASALAKRTPKTTFPDIGNKLIAKVGTSEIPCSIGMKQGDEFELGLRKCGDFCGFFYSTIHQSIREIQFDKTALVGDVHKFTCPNPKKQVQLEIRVERFS